MDALIQTRTVGLAFRPHDCLATGQCQRGLSDAVFTVSVQLAVVRHQAERLRHRGMGIGVSGEAGMEKQPAHLMIGVGQIPEVRDYFIGIQTGFKNLGA